MTWVGFQTIPPSRDAIREAVRNLVSIETSGESVFVRLPFIFPGGTPTTVCVSKSPNGYMVSDHGFTYRELEAIGAERSFGRTAFTAAEIAGIEKDRRRLFVEADEEDISRAICDVAMASWNVVSKVYADKRDEEDEYDLEDELTEKLISLFGHTKVKPKEVMRGTSSIEWDVSAIVETDHQPVVFQAVSNHSTSIYRTNSAFHDIATIKTPPKLVAVVRSKQALGSRLSLLTQAGRVIEEDQPEDVFRRAAS